MEVFNPTGASSATARFAPRLKSLHDQKIALLSNEQWQAYRTLPLVGKLLEQEYPLATFEMIRVGTAIQNEETVDAIAKQGFDAVIIGNAA